MDSAPASRSDIPPVDSNLREDPEAMSQWMHTSTRESIKEAVRRGDIDELRRSAESYWSSINSRFSKAVFPVEEFEPDIHSLWFLYYNCARNIPYSGPEQDRLALDILRVQALGTLTRVQQRDASISGTGDNNFIVARTSGGVIWDGMPFFVEDITKYWVKDLPTMKASERLNLAYLLAKIASVGLDKDGLFHIVLLLFRETFETVRPLSGLGDYDDASPSRTMADLSIGALLPLAYAWLFAAGDRIVQLSDKLWNDCPGIIGQCGTITFNHPESELSAGFSPWRWMHWLKRAEEILHEATRAGEDSIAASATEVLDAMLGTIEWRDSRVKREVEAAGGVVQYEQTWIEAPPPPSSE